MVGLTVCTADPIEDCGSGVRIERRYLDVALDGIAWWHVYNGSEREGPVDFTGSPKGVVGFRRSSCGYNVNGWYVRCIIRSP